MILGVGADGGQAEYSVRGRDCWDELRLLLFTKLKPQNRLRMKFTWYILSDRTLVALIHDTKKSI